MQPARGSPTSHPHASGSRAAAAKQRWSSCQHSAQHEAAWAFSGSTSCCDAAVLRLPSQAAASTAAGVPRHRGVVHHEAADARDWPCSCQSGEQRNRVKCCCEGAPGGVCAAAADTPGSRRLCTTPAVRTQASKSSKQLQLKQRCHPMSPYVTLCTVALIMRRGVYRAAAIAAVRQQCCCQG